MLIRTLLILWLGPLFLLGIWYGLAVNDYSMGLDLFSRAMHDEVFMIYGEITGIEPHLLPPLVFKAIVFDSSLIMAFIAFRLRKSWWPLVVRSFNWAFRPELRTTGQGSLAE